MRLFGIFRFEVDYLLRQPMTWLYFIVVIGFSVLSLFNLLDLIWSGKYFLNSPIIIARTTAVCSMYGLLLIAAVSGNAATKDFQSGIHPLVYTTSINKNDYLTGKVMAAFLISLLALVFFIIFIFITSIIPSFGDFFIPLNTTSYINSFLFFAFPNALIGTGILYSVSILTRKASSGYVVAAFLFFLALLSSDVISTELGLWELGKMLDPSGLTILQELQMEGSPLETKYQPVQLNSFLLFNRLFWLGITAFLLYLTYSRFKFSHPVPTAERRVIKNNVTVSPGKPKVIVGTSVLTDKRSFSIKTQIQQTIFLILYFFKDLIRSNLWLLIPVTAIIITVASNYFLKGQMSVPSVPITWRVLQLFTFLFVNMAVALMITFFSGQLVWKERDATMSSITDITPVPTWTLFFSKFMALVLLLIIFQIIFLIAGITIQLINGYYEFDLWLYFRVLFGFRLVDYLLFAVVAFIVHVLVNQKYIGYLGIFTFYFYMQFSNSLGIHHNLLIYGSDPGFDYSLIRGFDPHVVPWLWFKSYWAAWAVLFSVITILFWVRGQGQSLKDRFRSAKFGSSGMLTKILICAGLIVVILGSYIFYNTNIQNTYYTPAELVERRIQYEMKYGEYEGIFQPSITDVSLNVEIYPEAQSAMINGEYNLLNKTEASIDSVHVATNSWVVPEELRLNKDSEIVFSDTELHHYIFALAQPLQPGDSLKLNFILDMQQKDFSNKGYNEYVVRNGTYLHSEEFMPKIGYQYDRQIRDKAERKKYQLSPRPAIPPLENAHNGVTLSDQEKINLEAVVGTSINQVAVTSGELLKTWTNNERSYFHYVTDAPIRNSFPLFSANYSLQKSKWNDIDIQVFHHPEHRENIGKIIKSTQATLEYCTKNFGSYPHTVIKFVENFEKGMSLRSNPISISFSEEFLFFTPEEALGQFDYPFAVIAHEVAFQWWGNKFIPAHVEGAPLLNESISWYCALMVVKETSGPEHLERLLLAMRVQYLEPRSRADVPLLYSFDSFNAYQKGPFALYTLQEYIGEAKINSALNELLKEYSSGEPPLPTTLELYEKLYNVTPDSLQYLVKDLFKRNTFWELKAKEATVEAIDSGEWQVSLNVHARKVEVDTTGKESPLPINDFIEIGIYGVNENGERGKQLYLKMHHITSENQEIIVKLNKEPHFAGIDPGNLLIDQNVWDNLVKLDGKK